MFSTNLVTQKKIQKKTGKITCLYLFAQTSTMKLIPSSPKKNKENVRIEPLPPRPSSTSSRKSSRHCPPDLGVVVEQTNAIPFKKKKKTFSKTRWLWTHQLKKWLV